MGNPRTGLVLSSVILCIPSMARATEGDLGVSVGGMLAGTVPHVSVSPHLGLSITLGSFRVAIRDMCNLLPAVDAHGIGVYNHLAATVGYAWPAGDVGLGPSLGVFSMPACGVANCARLSGVAAGGTAQVSVYFAERWGGSARVSVDWMKGFGNVLPASAVLVAVVGPVFRWSMR